MTGARVSRRVALGAGVALLAARTVAGATTASKARPARIISERELSRRLARGRPAVVHFWATWCEACVEELPLIDQFWREAKRRGIDVHAVSLDEPTPEAAQLVGDVLQQVKVGGLGALIVELRNPDTFMFKLDPNWGGELRSREGQARLGGTHDPRILFFKTFVADLTTPVKK